MMKIVNPAGIGLFAAAFMASAAFAETVTWVGGATENGSWNKASNWDKEKVPTTGDTVVFKDRVFLTDKIDLGSGLTISNTAAVKIFAAMKGKGNLVKMGAGTLSFAATTYGEFSGGVQVNEGKFAMWLTDKTKWGVALSGMDSKSLLGNGTITVSGSGVFHVYGDKGTFNNPVVISNHTASKALSVSGTETALIKWTGGVECDGDFSWDVESYKGQIYIGKISAPGKTVSLTSTQTEWYTVFLSDEVDANLVVDTAQLCVQLQGASRNPCNTLTVKSQRKFEMAGGAAWGGRLVIENTDTRVELLGNNNLLPTSFVSINDGGAANKKRLTIDKFNYTIRGFSYNGAIQTSGEVSAATVGAAVSGSQKMTIDSSIKMWTGGASGAWSDAANWETQEVPVSGDTAMIPSAVAFDAETIDIGENGLTVDCYGNVTGALILSGSGKFVKRGGKNWTTGGKYLLTGGVRIEEGRLVEMMRGDGLNGMTDGLGTGTIEITGSGCWNPQAYLATNTQPVVIFEHDSSTPIRTEGSFVNLGTVSADADFTIYSHYLSPCFLGEIAAPGKTVTYLTYNWNTEWQPFEAEFADVNANLVIDAQNKRNVRLTGTTDRRDCALTVNAGKVVCPSSQGWGAIALKKGTTVTVPEGVILRGEALDLGGTAVERGKYSARRLAEMGLDGYLLDEGRIQVGDPLGLVITIR